MRTRNLERLDYGGGGTQYDDYDGYKTTTEDTLYSSATGHSANRLYGHGTSRTSKYDYDYGMDDNACDDTYTMYDDGQWEMNSCSGIGRRTTSSTTNKLLPKVPMKHSMSVTDSIAGATLLPGATLVASSTVASSAGGASAVKKSRLLPQPMAKSSTSRMLPKMPPASNTARHRVPLIRRNDSEYSDHDSMYSAYSYRPGAVSAIQFNEDYNYAYQSTDSLNTTAQSVLSEYGGGGGGGVGDRRSKMSAISGAVPIASGTLKSTSSSAAASATTSSRYHAYGSRTQPSSFDQVFYYPLHSLTHTVD